MLVRIPDYFRQSTDYQKLFLDDFMFVAYGQNQPTIRKEVFIAEHCIITVLEGTKVLHFPHEEVCLPKGSTLFLKRGCYVMSEIMGDQRTYSGILFFLHEKIIRTFFQSNPDLLIRPQPKESLTEPSPPFTRVSTTPAIGRLNEAILACLHYQGPYLTKLLRLRCEELLLCLLEADPTGDVFRLLQEVHWGGRLELEPLMESHFTKPLSIPDWAKLSGRSVSTFKRDFIRQFGTYPGHWLKQKRLAYADFLLRNSSLNVSEVALESGFENVSNFIKSYKMVYGYTPSTAKRTEMAIK